MRCKKHPADVSGTVGVCASCLRLRLFAVIAAQEQQNRAKSDSQQQQQQPPPLSFPRSVSPYISRRKSDTTAAATWQIHGGNGNHQLFHSTPLVLPTGRIPVEEQKRKNSKSKISSLFRNLFRSKSDLDSDPSPRSGKSADAHRNWMSSVFPGRRRKKEIRTFSLDEAAANRRNLGNRDRGMSPARFSDDEEGVEVEDGHCNTGYASEKQTPWRTPAMRRGGTAGHNINMANLAFCLSPLVRPSPNRNWNMPPEAESRVPAKPRLSTTTSFCKNRSRKLADTGRYNYNPNY